jgi:hypothetical protein
VAEETLPLL